MRSCSGDIIVLLGIDGCGKSSVLHRLRSEGFPVSEWQDLREVAALAFMREATLQPWKHRGALPPMSRAAYLCLALFAEYELIIQPALEKHSFVVVDSYYYRAVAKEILRGKTCKDVLKIARLLPPPCLVIVLDISPSEAFERKPVSMTEVLLEQTLADFTGFQDTVLRTALEMVDPESVRHIDASRSREEVYSAVRDIIGSRW